MSFRIYFGIHTLYTGADAELDSAWQFQVSIWLPPIQPRGNFERQYDLFMDDYTEVNKKRTKKSLPELSVAEYAKIMNIDMQDPLSLLKYKPGKIDWEKVLKWKLT